MMNNQQNEILNRLENVTGQSFAHLHQANLYDRFQPVPEYLNELLKPLGENIYGEPLFKIIWGCAKELDFVSGGFYADTNDYEYRVIIDQMCNKFMLMKWCPPEVYGSEEIFYNPNSQGFENGFWSQPVYPSRGKYEKVYVFQPRDNYVKEPEYDIRFEPPLPELVRWAANNVNEGHLYSRAERDYYQREKLRKEQEDREKTLKDVIGDAMPTIGTPYFNKLLQEYEIRHNKKRVQPLGTDPFSQISNNKVRNIKRTK
jgi:hypothetical protein